MTVWDFVQPFSPLKGALSLFAGLVLGIAYFWGLWWTSARVALVRFPGLFFTGSFVLRMAGLLVIMFWVTRGQPIETALCVVGLMVGRRVVIARVQPKQEEGQHGG